MAEPALVALVGVGSAALGAVASGGVQAGLARVDRQRDTRSAARLLYMQLHDADGALEDLLQLSSWDAMQTDWEAYGRAWERHAEALAGALNTTDFHIVSSAFACLASVARSSAAARRAKETTPPVGTAPSFAINANLFQLYRANVNAARKITLHASFTRRELRRGDNPSPD